MRVLVTGGAGFIGSHVVDAALDGGHEVCVLDNLSTGRRENVPAGVRLYEVDVRDRAAVERAFVEFRPELVSHQAAQSSVPASLRDPKVDADITIIGGLNVLDASVAVSAEHVVFASSGGALYGEVERTEGASETSPTVPISPYGITKLAFEQLLGVYQEHRGIQCTSLRYANVYGPRQVLHGEAGVVAVFFDALLADKPVCVFGKARAGDAGCLRDYTYVGDVARANLLSLSGKLDMRILNVGTGTATSTLDLAQNSAKIAARTPVIQFGPPRPGDIRRSVLDPAHCIRHLGGLVSLEEGLLRTFEWYASRNQ